MEDAAAGREPAAPLIPPPEAGQEAVVAAVLASAYAQMDQDRKSTALKALQARARRRQPARRRSAAPHPGVLGVQRQRRHVAGLRQRGASVAAPH